MSRNPVVLLEIEHRCIQKVVGAIALHADAIESGGPLDLALLEEILGFMRAYADESHHGKEEAVLFPALEAKGVPPGGCPLGALKHDHIAGRGLVTELAAAVSGCRAGHDAQAEVLASMHAVVALYPGHIWREDYLLFPMTGKVLVEDDLDRLTVEFDRLDAAFGVDRLRRFEEWADALAAKALVT